MHSIQWKHCATLNNIKKLASNGWVIFLQNIKHILVANWKLLWLLGMTLKKGLIFYESMWFHGPCSEFAVMEFLATWNCNSASIGILIKKSRGSYLDQIDKSIFSQFWMNWIQLKLIEPVLRNSIVCKKQRTMNELARMRKLS